MIDFKVNPTIIYLISKVYTGDRTKVELGLDAEVEIEVKQQPYIEEEEYIIGEYLFNNKEIEEAKRRIRCFWMIIEKKRREIEGD